LPAALAAAAGLYILLPAWALNTQRLEPGEIETLQGILQALDPVVTPKKQDGSAILLTWEELYAPLTQAQRQFLDAFRGLKAKELGATSHYFGEPQARWDIAPVGPQQILKEGRPSPLNPQFLPRNVLDAYGRMMDAMEAAIGRRLLVESGYRSPAYQLYLFLFYMPKHDHSVAETNRFVALPGHSEHGYPPRQAIDFINEEGINGEDRPEEFEALPEYRWLQEHAREFGFHLSYPRGNAYNTAFEPWHWHYEEQQPATSNQQQSP
jgi:LAS superfamily LD-carboxypeptidase LdcB